MKKNRSAGMGNSEREGPAWGKGEMANMPQEVTKQHYPKSNQFGPTDLNDTITGIDSSNSSAHSKSRSHISNQH